MDRETFIARIGALRAGLRALLDECDCPQIEKTLRNADMELHWALWNLGLAVPLRPEAEYFAEAGANSLPKGEGGRHSPSKGRASSGRPLAAG